jgi:hypothetical protein
MVPILRDWYDNLQLALLHRQLQELETRFPNVVVRYDFNDYHGGPIYLDLLYPQPTLEDDEEADNPWVEALDEFLDNLQAARYENLPIDAVDASLDSDEALAHDVGSPFVDDVGASLVQDVPAAILDVLPDATFDAAPVLPTAVVDAIPDVLPDATFDAAPVLPAADLDAISGPPFHDALSIVRRPSYNAVYILAGFGVLAFSILATGLQFFQWVFALKQPCTVRPLLLILHSSCSSFST